jgi:DNA-binding transcriptional ArsR family regulator
MKQLADAGLVTREQRGKWAYYRVVDDTLLTVAQAIAPTGARTCRGNCASRQIALPLAE